MRKSVLACLLLIVILSGCAVSVPNGYRPGWNYYNQGQTEKAVQYFQSRDTGCTQCLCKIYSDIGQYEKAAKSCEDALRTWQPVQRTAYGDINALLEDGLYFEGKAVWVVRLSDAYEHTGQFGRAIEVMKQWVTADNPNDENGFVRLSKLYIKNKQYDEAITAAKRAIELKSDNVAAYHHLGIAYGEKKQYDEAMKALKKAIEINPKMSEPYGWLGRFLMEKNAYNEAIEAYKKAVELQPADIDYLISLANIYRVMGRYDDAIASVNKAITLQTFTGIGINSSIEGGYTVVKGVMEAGPAKKADILAGDKIIKIDGKSTKGWTDEKVTQNLRGAAGTQVVLTIERKGAEKTIDKTVTRETIIAKEAALSFGLRSLAYRHKGSLEAALTDAEKAYSLDSANDVAQLSLGAAYLDRGKYDESIKLLAQVKDSPRARLYEATAYAKQGKMKEAVNIYFSIPEEEMSPKNIPLMNDRMALLQTFKPIVKEHRDKARTFESKGQYKEALSELSEALKIADDTELQDIQETLFSMIRRNPLLSEVPEDARKYALRSEVLVKEGNFEQAVTEIKKAIQIAPYATQLYYNSALWNAELKKYPEAIRNMKIYLKAAPDAPDARDAKDGIIKWEFMMEKEKTF
ncbi:MAG: tetratricopeptide repeat protein [Nitrospirae bacterium]|nr:tetratricopeptide repeat protein [Nitrospirota bacterium]